MRNDLTDFQMLVYPTAEEMEQLETDVEDMIKECTFNGITCDMKEDFVQNYNQQYGFCYTFNSGFDNKPDKIQ